MSRKTTGKRIFDLSKDEALMEKKRIISHHINLECKKEQLLILIEKLYKISSERIRFLSEEQNDSVNDRGSYLFSIGEQLNNALNKKRDIDKEINEAKNMIKTLETISKNKK